MYIDINDLKRLLSEQEIIELSDDEDIGEINEDVVEGAIEDAESEVNAYLVAKYRTPLSPVPQIIKKLCVDIAIYNLFSRRLQDEPPENVRKRYKDAKSILKMISEGQIVLSASLLTASGGWVKENQQVFSRNTLEGF